MNNNKGLYSKSSLVSAEGERNVSWLLQWAGTSRAGNTVHCLIGVLNVCQRSSRRRSYSFVAVQVSELDYLIWFGHLHCSYIQSNLSSPFKNEDGFMLVVLRYGSGRRKHWPVSQNDWVERTCCNPWQLFGNILLWNSLSLCLSCVLSSFIHPYGRWWHTTPCEAKVYQVSTKASRMGRGGGVGKMLGRRLQGWNQLGWERLLPPALQDPQGGPRWQDEGSSSLPLFIC